MQISKHHAAIMMPPWHRKLCHRLQVSRDYKSNRDFALHESHALGSFAYIPSIVKLYVAQLCFNVRPLFSLCRNPGMSSVHNNHDHVMRHDQIWFCDSYDYWRSRIIDIELNMINEMNGLRQQLVGSMIVLLFKPKP